MRGFGSLTVSVCRFGLGALPERGPLPGRCRSPPLASYPAVLHRGRLAGCVYITWLVGAVVDESTRVKVIGSILMLVVSIAIIWVAFAVVDSMLSSPDPKFRAGLVDLWDDVDPEFADFISDGVYVP